MLDNDTDVDQGNVLSVTGASLASGEGSVSFSSTEVTFQPSPDYNFLAVGQSAIVKINYTISDGHGGVANSVLTVTVNGRNDQPTANPDTASISEDASVAAAVLANDSDPDTLDVLTVSVGSGLGGVSTDGTQVIYDPGDSYNYLAVGQGAIVVINYTISDGHGGTSGSSLTVTVNGLNDAPTANPDLDTTTEDDVVSTEVLTNDTDPDAGAVLAVTAAVITSGRGAVSFSVTEVIFDPRGEYDELRVGQSELVEIDYVISDGFGGISSSRLTVTVTGVNDAPQAVSQSKSVGEDGSVAITLAGTDVENDSLAFSIATPPQHGTLSGVAPNIIYTPFTNYQGADSFTYYVSDGLLNSEPAEVSLNVLPAPRVTDVVARFGTKSYSLLTNTRQDLPWINITAIEVVFSQDVAIDANDIRLAGVAGNYVGTSFSYNNSTRTASLGLASALTKDRLTLRLDGDGMSADANAGIQSAVDAVFLKLGDYSRGFNVLAGDADNSGVVNTVDSTWIRNRSPGYGTYDLFADLDGDGDVDAYDMNEPRKRLNWRLP